MRLSLKTKIFFTLLAIVVICAGVATYLVSLYSEDRIIDREKNNLEFINIEQSHEIRQIFRYGVLVSASIAKDEEFIKSVTGDSEFNKEELIHHINHLNIGDIFSALYLLDKDGETIVSTDRSFEGNNYSFRKYYQESIKGSPYIDMAIGATSRLPGYYFSTPMYDQNDDIVGIAVAKMKPDFLQEAIGKKYFLERFYISLADSCGIIVYSYRDDKIYKSLGEMSQEKCDEVEKSQRFPEIYIESLGYDIVQQNIDSIEGKDFFELYDKKDGQQKIISVVRIPQSDFFVILEANANELVSMAENISYILFLVAIFAALIFAGIISLIVSSFLKPLKHLEKSAKEIMRGNYDVYVDVKSKDELGKLADSFNKMAKQIKKSSLDINKKVEKRTSQLEKLNKFMTGRELKMRELKKKIQELETNKNENTK